MKIKTIVVPTDLSHNSLRALEPAVDFAKRFGADILLVHVLDAPIYPAMKFANLPTIQQEVRDTVARQLDRLCNEHIPGDVVSRTVMREGHPFFEIIAVAKEERADLIVIATHGHTGIKHLLLGSTAEKVVRQAPCPVLIVRCAEA
jgi:nucleotide-binding universal stress UspA family protein